MDKRLPIFILVGGFGTRLQSVLKKRPKPMASVNSKPFLEYLLLWLKKQSYTQVTLLTHYLGSHIQDYFGSGKKWGLSIDYVFEESPLGTGGAVKNALNQKNHRDKFLLLNGDSFVEADLDRFVKEADPFDGGIILSRQADTSRFGRVQFCESKFLTSFQEKEASLGPGHINAGVYLLGPSCLSQFSKDQFSLEKELFPVMLERGQKLFCHLSESFFMDIGTPASYNDFQNHMENKIEL